MWEANWRDRIWSELARPWDIVVIGGGITGAGILRRAAGAGLQTLLVEQGDFGSGTSSRSSKMVHGGLRYLTQGNVPLVWEAVHEREELLRAAPGLVEPISFLLPRYGGVTTRWFHSLALSIYDLMAGRMTHRHYDREDMRLLAPTIRSEGLRGGFGFRDAQTDDARLVLRVIKEGVAKGGVAISRVRAAELLRDGGQVVGVRLQDRENEREIEVRAKAVINATGAWADVLRSQIGAKQQLRPLRGSHLVFTHQRLPVAQAIIFSHPWDQRSVMMYPWEGATIIGTTDLDHRARLEVEPTISPNEVSYLMAGADAMFPTVKLQLEDIIATWSGVRPVVASGKADPSKEPRDSVLWQEQGLLTVTGGKLTTFPAIADQALESVMDRLPGGHMLDRRQPVLDAVAPELSGLDGEMARRLIGRFGADAPALVQAAQTGELTRIPGTETLWGELRWAARTEGVLHLDDLLLRRVRIGLLLPEGGRALLPAIRRICQAELGWDDERWEAEEEVYRELWQAHYSLPTYSTIPEWHRPLTCHQGRDQTNDVRRSRRRRRLLALGLTGLVVIWRAGRKPTPAAKQ